MVIFLRITAKLPLGLGFFPEKVAIWAYGWDFCGKKCNLRLRLGFLWEKTQSELTVGVFAANIASLSLRLSFLFVKQGIQDAYQFAN